MAFLCVWNREVFIGLEEGMGYFFVLCNLIKVTIRMARLRVKYVGPIKEGLQGSWNKIYIPAPKSSCYSL